MPTSQRSNPQAYGQGKARGAQFHSELGPARARDLTDRDRLRQALSEAMVGSAMGREPDDVGREGLRRLAVQNREYDWDGAAQAAIAFLTEHGDRAARSWLPPILAGAGRYHDAAALRPDFAPGRPPAPDYLVLVTALDLIGERTRARELYSALTQRFGGLAEDFVSVWDATAEGIAFDQLVRRAPGNSQLPVFLHLPFCGGTSMISSLKRALPWAARIEVGRRYGLFQIERALSMPAETAAELRLVHLHHPFPLEVAGRGLTYFTVLRDPVSQLSSGYYKRRDSTKIVPTRDAKEQQSASFEAHADYTMANGLTNMLARQLITTHPDLEAPFRQHFRGIESFRTIGTEEAMFWFQATADLAPDTLLRMARETLTDRFHLVGTMQHLAASHLAGAAGLGLPVTQRIGHRGRSSRPKSGRADALEAKLRNANAVDQQLYEEYTERFERDYPELINAIEKSSPPAEQVAPV